MSKIKKITALNIVAVILAMSLTACGSNDVKNISDEQDVPEITENTTENSAQDEDSDAADEITSEPETLDVLTFMPETCEDYIKLANAYLQMDDVIQALAVLDEGMEKLAIGEQGAELQDIDLLSQRKEYILAGTIAVKTKYVENVYDEEGEVLTGYASERDESGNKVMFSYYGTEREVSTTGEHRYDANGNEIEYEYKACDSDGNISSFSHETWAYDADGNKIEYISYDEDGNISSKTVRKYDAFGNETEFANYNSDGECIKKRIQDYDERGNLIREIWYDSNGRYDRKWEYDYDERGNKIKGTKTSYNEETELKASQTIEEYEYDENENMTKYAHIVYDEEKGTDSHTRERKYDADGRETDFYLYINEKTVSYHSQTEYDENGWMINYTEYDKNGALTGRKETEYDTDGNMIKESHYDADGSLIRCYENEYDDFGSITRQAMYENGILKTEKQIGYAYHYIGNMDIEAADDFICFLKGQKEVCYYDGSIEDAGVVRKSITNLIDFSHCRKNKITPQYAFLDMTGDGAEELIINCDRGELYVIQNDIGVLKVIFNSPEYSGAAKLVKGNGRTGICTLYSNRDSSCNIYNFLDENGKKQIPLDAVWDSEGEVSYRYYDSFEWYSISEGEYYDMTEMMTEIDIDWQKLEDPNYGND